jgi:hypothetical protein
MEVNYLNPDGGKLMLTRYSGLVSEKWEIMFKKLFALAVLACLTMTGCEDYLVSPRNHHENSPASDSGDSNDHASPHFGGVFYPTF